MSGRTPIVLGAIWRDSNVRTGPSLDHPVVDLLLPDGATTYRAESWTHGDEVVEGEHPDGEIVSSVWFRLADGRWCSAVNFDPVRLSGVLGADAPAVRPHRAAPSADAAAREQRTSEDGSGAGPRPS